MQITQEEPDFKPVNIRIESRLEAQLLASLLKKLELFRTCADATPTFDDNEIKLLVLMVNTLCDELDI